MGALKGKIHDQELDRQQHDHEEEQQSQHLLEWQQHQPKQPQHTIQLKQPPRQQGATHAEARGTLTFGNASKRPHLSQWPHQPQQRSDLKFRETGSSNKCGNLRPFMLQQRQEQQQQQQQHHQWGPLANTCQYQKASMLLLQPPLGPQVRHQEQQGSAQHGVVPAHDQAATASAAQMKALQDLACDLEQADEALDSSRHSQSAWEGAPLSSTTELGPAAPLHIPAERQDDNSCTGNRAAATRRRKTAPDKRTTTAAAAQGPRATRRGSAQPKVVRARAVQQQPHKGAKSTGGMPQASGSAAAAAGESAAPAAESADSAAATEIETAAHQPSTINISELDAGQVRALYLHQRKKAGGAPKASKRRGGSTAKGPCPAQRPSRVGAPL
ncbi:hypothetical protein ACSSS7_002246 [Eimeria intestinalis]